MEIDMLSIAILIVLTTCMELKYILISVDKQTSYPKVPSIEAQDEKGKTLLVNEVIKH